MRVVRQAVGRVHHLHFEQRLPRGQQVPVGEFAAAFRVLHKRLTHLPRQVQAGKVGVAFLELIDEPQRVQIVIEPAMILQAIVERVLAGVSEGRMAQIVRQRDRFGQVLIERQSA